MPKVLIHIGYPKTGSTWLQKWFENHPAMLYRQRAVAGFFNAHDLARYAQKAEKLQEVFVLSSEDLSVWKGDYNITGFASKGYDMHAYSKNLTRMLHDIFHEPYILIVTRGYEGMLRSLYSQYVRGGGLLNFEELQQEFGNEFSVLYDYSWLINLYREIFGSEKVIVLPFELLQSQPVRFTALIEDRLGLTENFNFRNEKVNPSLTPQELAATRKISTILFRSLGFLPESWRTVIYGYHIRHLAKNARSWPVKLLAPLCKPDEVKVNNAMLELFKGKAEILRNEALFQPWIKEYLL